MLEFVCGMANALPAQTGDLAMHHSSQLPVASPINYINEAHRSPLGALPLGLLEAPTLSRRCGCIGATLVRVAIKPNF